MPSINLRMLTSIGILAVVAVGAGCQGGRAWLSKKSTPNPGENTLVDEESLKISHPKHESPNARMLVDFGNLRASMKQHAQAADLFGRAIKNDPKCVDAYVGLAKVKMSMGHPDQAITALKEGLKAQPKSAPLWNEMGIAYTKMQKWPEAIAAMEKAIKYDPQEDLYQSNLAGVLTVCGKVDRAFRMYSEQMTAADAHTQIARILGGQGKMAECQWHLDKALSEDPSHAMARTLRSRLSEAPALQAVGYETPDDEVARRPAPSRLGAGK